MFGAFVQGQGRGQMERRPSAISRLQQKQVGCAVLPPGNRQKGNRPKVRRMAGKCGQNLWHPVDFLNDGKPPFWADPFCADRYPIGQIRRSGKGGIATLATDGTVIDKDWLTGLNAPKGMAMFKNRLYVADITELVVIDIKKRELIKKIPIADSVFLNDVTVNSSGIVYVSDTRTNKIHQIKNDVPSLYLENMTSANGLKVFGSSLIVGADKELLLVGRDKKPLTLATGFAQGIDGIEMVSRGEFIVSCWPGLVYYVYSDGKIELLIDSQAEKINTADIGFDPNTRQVFIPNFFKNSVTAYQLN